MTRRCWPALALASLVLAGAPATHSQPVEGFVDLHSHLMGEHSFGGSWFWGRLEGPIDQAVPRCDGNFLTQSHAATIFPIVSEAIGGTDFDNESDTGWHLGKRRGYDTRRCRRLFGVTIPGTCPRPHFEHWPKWSAIAHQQMWQGWLQDAQRGGLRVMVVSLAESNFLCQNTPPWRRRYDCNEMNSVQRQLGFLRGFVGRNASWVGVAETPAQARALIAQGKLALVLSVEITQLFPGGDFVSQLDAWRALGIRSVQVVHHADNRFAGAAPIPELIKAANLSELLTGNPWLTQINDIVCRDASGAARACNGDDSLNERGLSSEGSALVRAMMDRGLLLDVAHLSRRAFRDVHALSAPRGYPLLYSHTHAWDTIDAHEKRHEKYLRADEIALLTDNGGMVGLRTGPEDTVAYGGTVANGCQGSARSFAQSLMYLVDRGLSVGFGADLNGFTRQLRPRHRDSCWFDKVQIDWSGGPNQLQSKGLAHVGLLPALRADLQTVGVPASYLAHIDRSAETFLQLWERSASLAVTGASNLALGASASASSTYCQGSGEHCYSAARVNDGNNTTALGGYSSWANAGYTPLPQWIELSWSSPVTFSRVELYTTTGYALRDYDVQHFNGAVWVNLASESNNTAVHRTHAFAPLSTTRLRVAGRSGPSHQPGYVRVNEIEVY